MYTYVNILYYQYINVNVDKTKKGFLENKISNYTYLPIPSLDVIMIPQLFLRTLI